MRQPELPPIPMTTPISVRTIPCRITMLRRVEACAPSAMRMPLGWPRGKA
jgi:hypothetical protein